MHVREVKQQEKSPRGWEVTGSGRRQRRAGEPREVPLPPSSVAQAVLLGPILCVHLAFFHPRHQPSSLNTPSGVSDVMLVFPDLGHCSLIGFS